jgi:Ca-activated chloride channel family protein
MLAPFEGSTRIEAAKAVLSDLVDSLKAVPNLELGLRVYGHQYPRNQQNCRDTRLEVAFKPGNHNLIKTRLDMIRPKGTTPLAYSLEKAAGDFPDTRNVRNILIIITDGLESCDGDPCAISLEIQRKGVLLKPFVIGLGLDLSVKTNFDCLGEYLNAENKKSFQDAISKVTTQSLEPTTVSVQLLDHQKRPIETDVNISFINNFTGQTVYDFVHYLDKQGRPDTIFVEPVIGYNIQVHTIPPVSQRNIRIMPGQHNLLKFDTPQGDVIFKQQNSTDYLAPVTVLIKKSLTSPAIHRVATNEPTKLLAGNYALEMLTLPTIYIKDFEVIPGQQNELTIPSPAVVNLGMSSSGITSLYLEKPGGRYEWIKNLDTDKKAISFALQPGDYKLVYRADDALGSKYTLIKKFNASSGETINLKF